MIGGNKLWTFYRATETRDSINAAILSYDIDSPLYQNKWCRKVLRNLNEPVTVEVTDSARPLVEDFLLIVPIDLTIQEDDIGLEVDTGYYYQIMGVEDVSRMGQTYQCPIVRIPGLTQVAA